MKDHYSTLHVPPYATDDEVKAAYRRLAKLYHPDLRPGDAAAEETEVAAPKQYRLELSARIEHVMESAAAAARTGREGGATAPGRRP